MFPNAVGYLCGHKWRHIHFYQNSKKHWKIEKYKISKRVLFDKRWGHNLFYLIPIKEKSKNKRFLKAISLPYWTKMMPQLILPNFDETLKNRHIQDFQRLNFLVRNGHTFNFTILRWSIKNRKIQRLKNYRVTFLVERGATITSVKIREHIKNKKGSYGQRRSHNH